MNQALFPYQTVLEQVPLFQGIPTQARNDLLSCLNARLKRYEKNATVISAGANGNMGIVLEGTLRLCDIDRFGNQSLLSVFRAGDLFGAASTLSSTPSLFSVMATQSATVLLFDGERMINPCTENCTTHLTLLQNALRLMAERNVHLSQKIEILGKHLIRDKLLTYLHFCENEAQSASFEIPFDRQGLADFLCVERSALSATISKLQKEGVLSASKRHFTLFV